MIIQAKSGALGRLAFYAITALAAVQGRAVTITEPMPAGEIQVAASSSWGGEINPGNLINGTGMDDQNRHDNNGHAVTMWHTVTGQKPSSPAPGLPPAAAWVRFTFKTSRVVNRCTIWNHNQQGLTNRGFHHALAYVTTDGEHWEAVMVNGMDTFEIPRASGKGAAPASYVLTLPNQPITGVILAAKDDYGSEHGADYYGLAAVQFSAVKNVAEADLPQPGALTAADFPFTVDSAGQWVRQVKVMPGCPAIYDAVDATVESGSATAPAHLDALPSGRASLLLDLPHGVGTKRSSTDKVRVTLKSARWSRALDTQIVPFKQWPNLEEVVITWKTHLDIGYTHHPLEVMHRYRTGLMDRALGLFADSASLPRNQRFIWMLPAWALEIVLDDQQTPDRRARLEQAVRDGRLIWHGLPYTFEAEAMDAEEMARCLAYGVRDSQRFNMPLVRDAKLTDVPVQAWLVPTVLAHAGINFLHIGCNGGSKRATVPTLFWWEGPDGSRLLTGYSNEYGWGPIPPANWTHKSWLAMVVTVDNSGPPSPDLVQGMLNQIKTQLPGVRARFGRPEDFAKVILSENSTDIPVVRKDMPDTWIHGMMSLPETSGLHREASMLLPSLGVLDTELGSWNVPRPGGIADVLRHGYEQSCFYTEHTWGPSGGRMPGGFVYDNAEFKRRYDQGIYVNYEAEFDFHANYARQAMAAAQGGIAPRIGALAAAVHCNGPRVTVFNPLPWPRTDAEVTIALPDGAPLPAAVRDAATHQPVPATLNGRSLRFTASHLPAGGYNTYELVAGIALTPPTASVADSFETAHFKVRFDLQRGGIASLVDKATGRELVNAATHTLGQFLHQRFDRTETEAYVREYCRYPSSWPLSDMGKAGMLDPKVSPHWDVTPGPWTISVTRDALGATATLTCQNTQGLADAFTLTFSFPDSRACVDIGWEVKNKTRNPIPEGGWLCVPLAMNTAPVFRVGEDGGSINPATDIVVGGDRELLAADRAITVREGDSGPGAGVASQDLPLWSLGQPGLWIYSPDYVPTKPELFANLYNNMWNTNYPHWVGGSWKASFRVWPVANGATEEQAVFTPAWELRQGVLAAYADGHAGALPLSQSGIALSRPGTRVTELAPNPYGDGTLLRIWEQAGVSGEMTATLPAGMASTMAKPVNLRGEPAGDAIAIRDGRFTFNLGAWAPASFILK